MPFPIHKFRRADPRRATIMLTVHHLDDSRSQRVLWLLEELGVPYEIAHYRRDAVTKLAPPELRAVHPLGKSPVVTDGDITVAETGAIVEYLVDQYGAGRLRPAAGTPEHLRFRYWLHFAEGSIQPQLLLKLFFDRIAAQPVPDAAKPVVQAISAQMNASYIGPNLRDQLDLMEAELARSAWFAGGDFSAADVQLSFPLEAAVERAGLDTSRPKLMSFLERIHARPAYRRALERGGPYRFAK